LEKNIVLGLKANLHWEVPRSSRARFCVCFIAPRSCRAGAQNYPTQRGLRLATLARPQCRLAFSFERFWYSHYRRSQS